MGYEKLLEAVQELDFIWDPRTADAAVKAVLGILASAMDENLAREFTESLPGPLTYDRLRGQQGKPLKIDPERYTSNLTAQFGLSEGQARLLITRTLALAREEAEKPEIRQILYTIEQELAAVKPA
jgi:uncharacterized protein (DUF2267 family)